MTMDEAVPELLRLTDLGDHTYRVAQPASSAEGRDVVYSGQLMGQMLMASDAVAEGAKDVRSIHALFARSGTYAKPIELHVDSMHAGRTWASDTVTAQQDGKLLARALVLLNGLDPDLMRHGPELPAGVPGPEGLESAAWQSFEGAEVRPVPGELSERGVPVERVWHRYPESVGSQAASQAVLLWATCGNSIALAMRPHRDRVRISDAHRTLSTGVIGHTVHFLERFDVSSWLLVETRAVSASGGRVHSDGSIFDEDGLLVATFHQDSMARAADRPLDPKRAM
jgi:acyl-CoA thioesterase